MRLTLHRFLLVGSIFTTVAFGVISQPALAQHPSESPNADQPEYQCNEANENGYILMPDGERWQCLYDPEANDYFWEPRAPSITPNDSVGWVDQYWAAPNGETFRITTRNEWINWIYYAGSDVFFRQPVTQPLTLPSGQVGFYQEFWVWNGTAWSECRDSGGWITGSGTGDGMVDTLNWGNAACGAGWYDAITWVEAWDAATSTWDVSPAVDPVNGGQNAGSTTTGQNGQVYDPPRGWNGKVPKRPSKRIHAGPPATSVFPPFLQSDAAIAARATTARK